MLKIALVLLGHDSSINKNAITSPPRALVQILSQPAFRAKVEEHIDIPKSQLEGCVYFKKSEKSLPMRSSSSSEVVIDMEHSLHDVTTSVSTISGSVVL